MLQKDSQFCKELILKETGYQAALFAPGIGSWYDTMNALAEIDQQIANLSLAIREGKADDGTRLLMKMYPRTEYDDLRNIIRIYLSTDSDLVPLLRTIDFTNMEESINDIIDSQTDCRIKEYYSCVRYLQKSVLQNTQNSVRVYVIPAGEYVPVQDLTEEWRPGL